MTADDGELLEAYASEHHVGPAPIEDIPDRDTGDLVEEFTDRENVWSPERAAGRY